MKSRSHLLVLSILIPQAAPAGQWWRQSVYRSPQSGSCGAQTRFLDASTGWGVSFEEETWKTADGGMNWTRQNNGNLLYLRGLSIAGPETVYAAGNGGLILKTSDGRELWTQLSSGSGSTMFDIHFLDRDDGWAVGGSGEILHTLDGGQFWHRVKTSTNYLELNAVRAVSPDIVVAAGASGTVLRTTDRGRSWQSIGPGPPYFHHIWALDFVGSEAGWFGADYAEIYRTADGGSTWMEATTPFVTDWVTDIDFVDAQRGWAVGGLPGFVWRSTDGGRSWQTQLSGGQVLYGVSFHDERFGWAVGGCGRILRTTDGGLTWTDQSLNDCLRRLNGVAAVSPTEAYAVGRKRFDVLDPEQGTFVLHTTDGGQSWQYEFKEYFNGSFEVAAIDGRAWICGAAGMIYSNAPPLRVEKSRLWWRQAPAREDGYTNTERVQYDVVRGDLIILRNTGGDFTAATVECLAENRSPTSLPHTDSPAPGEGWWFLLRGAGSSYNDTYDSGGPSQGAPRDAEINASAYPCR